MSPERIVAASVLKRSRTEAGRSKSGCTTCLRKKVKCDEQRPTCVRCVRLRLICEWNRDKTTLSERRRGVGSTKRRIYDGTWTPRTIQPKDDLTSDELTAREGLDVFQSQPCQPFDVLGDQDYSADLLIDEANNSNVGQTDGGCHEESIARISDSANLQLLSAASGIDDLDYGFLSELNLCMGRASFLEFETESIPKLTLSDDNTALNFHRMVFAPLRSTRKPSSSPLSHFVQSISPTNHAALHFVLAVSHSEMVAHYTSGSEAPMQAVTHFQKGSDALFQKMSSNMTHDHVEVLLSFLYLYHFWLRRRIWAPQRLHDLSCAALAYIKQYGLDDRCEDEISMFLLQHDTPAFSNVTIVPRVLIYLFDRDAFTAFSGFAGLLASYAVSKADLWLRIMQNSTSVFPASSAIHAEVLEMHVKMMFIHQEINMYSQNQIADEETRARIQEKFLTLQKGQVKVFDLLSSPGQCSVKPPTMAFVVLSFFYASKIYLCRSHNPGFGSYPKPAGIEAMMSSLMNAAYRAASRTPIQLLERLQWSLMIAAIETTDLVHLDWLQQKITDPAMRLLLTEILKIQQSNGGVISMHEIRDLFRMRT